LSTSEDWLLCCIRTYLFYC